MSTDGVVVERRPAWVSQATPDAIQHFVWGIGDNNPRWQGDRPAIPPCFYYAHDETSVAPGHHELGRFYRSAHWTWFDQPVLGVGLSATASLLGEGEVSGVIEQTVIEQSGRVDFSTVDGANLATVTTCIERRPKQDGAIDDRPEIRYDGAELDVIEATILSERHRGTTPRHWSDTAIGDQLGPLLKGPLSIMDVVAWCAGTQGVATASDEYSDGGLHDETATGPQQVSWFSQLVTDWMGDDAFLHRLEVHIVANPPLGSTTMLSGSVTELWHQDDLPLASVELLSTSQAGEVMASGRAMIVLPSPGAPASAVSLAEATPWQ